MTATHQYPKGSVLHLAEGDYEDFRSHGVFVAIQDLDLPRLAQMMTAGKSKYEAGSYTYDFAPWLVVNGYVIPVNASVVNLGLGGALWEKEFGVQYVIDPSKW